MWLARWLVKFMQLSMRTSASCQNLLNKFYASINLGWGTLANLWSFAKFANVFPRQCFPPPMFPSIRYIGQGRWLRLVLPRVSGWGQCPGRLCLGLAARVGGAKAMGQLGLGLGMVWFKPFLFTFLSLASRIMYTF